MPGALLLRLFDPADARVGKGGFDVGAAVVEAALANGLLVNSPRPECLRFMPALNVTQAEIDEMLVRLRAAL